MEIMSTSTASLRERIELEIRERGPMPFSRYMDICLYDPVQGYYSRNAEQFGKAGDFYTSSDVHAVFGRLMARQFEEIWRALDWPPNLEIVELGPGRGLFARDMLDWSKKKFPDFFSALTIILQESSPALRRKLEENLRDHVSSRKVELEFGVQAERPAGASATSVGTIIPRIIFANEFFDALPVEILSAQGKLYIACEHDRLCEVWLEPSPAELEFLDRYGVHPENTERIEVPIIAQNMMRQAAHELDRGVIIVIDYGYTRSQQLTGLHRGTLMTYRNHAPGTDPYQAPGEQDITSHVNFTALAAACEDAGMKCEKLLTQSQFLMGIGQCNEFADVFEDCRLPQEKAKVALQLKHLIAPEGMGETFKVLLASKRIASEKIGSLGGLHFAAGS
jgi:SAM-dependent MidA family methyltransferase